jgi:CheY-like chemotaxis protein
MQVVREVLANLLLNALEAQPAGGRVAISGVQTDGRVKIRVADGGPGLDPSRSEDIFAAGVSTKEESGRGIGLAGCRRLLADFAAGLAHVPDSRPGAVFEMDLPAAGGSIPGPVADAEVLIPSGTRVLVTDDEPAVRQMLADVLGELGCTVVQTSDGEQALKAVRQENFSVALIDQRLVGMTGLELAKKLRQGDPALAVVLLSGWGSEEVLAGADPGSVDLTARKPIAFAQVRDLVAKGAALHRRRLAGG